MPSLEHGLLRSRPKQIWKKTTLGTLPISIVNNNNGAGGNFIAVTAAVFCALSRGSALATPDVVSFNLTAAQRGRGSYQAQRVGAVCSRPASLGMMETRDFNLLFH